MTFQEFKNQARLYVLGALYPYELDEFEQAKQQLGPAAKAWIDECYVLRDSFALSLRPKSSTEAITQRLTSMVGSRAAGIA